MNASLEKYTELWLGGILLLVALLYFRTGRYEFAVDDFPAIAQNQVVQKGFSGIPEIWSNSFYYGYDQRSEANEYRPLTSTFFAIQVALFGAKNAGAMHLFSVLLYLAVLWSLFQMLRAWKLDTGLVLLSLLLFALHPTHTEVVANIKSQDELWMLFWLGLALWQWEGHVQGSPKSGIWASLFFLLALFSKESALLFLPVMAWRMWPWDTSRWLKPTNALPLAAAALFVLCRLTVLTGSPEVTVVNNALAYQNSRLDQLAMGLEFYGRYLLKMLWPDELIWSYDYAHFALHGWGDWKSMFGLVLFLGSLGLVWLWRKEKQRSSAVLWTLCGLILYIQIFFLIEATFADRFMFGASLGFLLLLVLLSSKVKYGAYAGLLLAMAYAWKSHDRIPDWKNNERLYEADIEKAPNSIRANSALAFVLSEKAQKTENQEARLALVQRSNELFEKAINVYSEDANTWFNFGMNHLMTGEYTLSELAFKEAIRLNPNHTSAYNNLGNIYYMRKEPLQAKSEYEKAVASDKANPEAWSNLGAMYLLTRQYDSAYFALSKADALAPGNENVQYNLGLAKKKLGY